MNVAAGLDPRANIGFYLGLGTKKLFFGGGEAAYVCSPLTGIIIFPVSASLPGIIFDRFLIK